MKFEALMKRLNEISALMDNEDLPLEDALMLYDEATDLVEFSKVEMEEARVKLREIFSGGEA